MSELTFPYIDTEFPANYVGNYIPGQEPLGTVQALSQPDPAWLVTVDGGFSWIDPNAPDTPAPLAEQAEAVSNGPYTPATTIIAFKVVAIRSDGTIEHADKNTIAHYGKVLGIANNSSVLPTELVTVTQIGTVRNNGWTFGTNDKFFLGNNGDITTTVPSTGFLQRIGLAVDNRTLLVEKHKPVLRS